MLNHAVLVGRLVEKPREMVKQKIFITLAVPRPYKNTVGEYDTDFVDVMLYKNIAENAKEYCDKGDLLGIKGRIESFSKYLSENRYSFGFPEDYLNL